MSSLLLAPFQFFLQYFCVLILLVHDISTEFFCLGDCFFFFGTQALACPILVNQLLEFYVRLHEVIKFNPPTSNMNF